jgi:hypothetical protein
VSTPVVTVNVAVPDPVTEVGLNDAEALAGKPVTDRLTAPAKPLTAPIVTVYVVEPPGSTLRVEGVAAIVKSGGGGGGAVVNVKSPEVAVLFAASVARTR